MGFLIRTSFWFSLVLLFLPIAPGEDTETVSPLAALVAARDAIGDVGGMCEREPQVCETGRAALQTIGVRARESARIAYQMLEPEPTADDAITTGGVSPAE
ncbi:hypothetical protein EJC49_21965 [Aquibium carbonis]|uniref:DUF5330 domain-containing protein n=1 Tax=Aquibium carbonis TaxID=2495581 RepID=A0A429YQY9_9HYPH|nr:DUF5330 domain-containing protein [Aquibium carbonis]RST83842.1 hypothetical protein EJC49_21965 [Aquibium carbonis]